MTTPTKTILEILNQTTVFFKEKGISSARLDAEVLLAHGLGLSRVALYTNFDKTPSADELERLRDLVRRRGKREPVATIVGEREFYSRRFRVTREVLTPRPETECLIEEIEKIWKDKTAPAKILDLGTGSGVLAITLGLLFPESAVTAIDLSKSALEIAKENAIRHEVSHRLSFFELNMGDVETLRPLCPFDLIVSNPPYLSEAEFEETMPEVKIYEPKLALVAAENGLFYYRKLFEILPALLSSQGVFAAEIGASQQVAIRQLFDDSLEKAGYRISFYKDYANLDRGVIVTPPGLPLS